MGDNTVQLWLIYGASWLLGVVITLWILWAIIRGAVLSALRKHAWETRQLQSLPSPTGALDIR